MSERIAVKIVSVSFYIDLGAPPPHGGAALRVCPPLLGHLVSLSEGSAWLPHCDPPCAKDLHSVSSDRDDSSISLLAGIDMLGTYPSVLQSKLFQSVCLHRS